MFLLIGLMAMIIKFPNGGRDNIDMPLSMITVSEINDMIAAAQHEPDIVRKLERILRTREGDECFICLNLMLELAIKGVASSR